MAKAQEGDNAQASQYWQKLIEQLPADSDSVNQIRQMLVELGEQPSAQPAVSDNAVNIHVQVAVDEAVKNPCKLGRWCLFMPKPSAARKCHWRFSKTRGGFAVDCRI